MSLQKTQTPTVSPKYPKSVTLQAPATPPSSKPHRRLSTYLTTPDHGTTLPYSPGFKRLSLGAVRSPEGPDGPDVLSPFLANMLKTPRNADDDDDGLDTPRRLKLLKTPQYFSGGKRLFAEEPSPTKKEFGELSLQLKTRLSLAFGSLQKLAGPPAKLEFPEPAAKASPTKLNLAHSRANLNLQTLQKSPVHPNPRTGNGDLKLRHSPVFGGELQRFAIPSPDEESSAHSALMAVFSRAKERRKSQLDPRNDNRPDARHDARHTHILSDPFHPLTRRPSTSPTAGPIKLPSLTLRTTPAPAPSHNSEEDAVYSLMSLSSPQSQRAAANGYAHPDSTALSRSSLVAMPVLPPISGLIRKVDEDETDIEEATLSE